MFHYSLFNCFIFFFQSKRFLIPLIMLPSIFLVPKRLLTFLIMLSSILLFSFFLFYFFLSLKDSFLQTCFFYCTYFDILQIMKNHVFCYDFSCVNVCEIRNCHFYIFLLDIHCTTFYIKNRSVKRTNTHFIICS